MVLDNIQWEKDSWTRLSLINLQSTKVYVISDFCCASEGFLQHLESNEARKNRVTGIQSGKSYRDYDAINGDSTEFEWKHLPRIHNVCSSVTKSIIC